MPPESGSREATIDLDLRSLASIRLIDAGPSEVRAIRRQLGPLPGRSSAGPRPPDLTVRFVDRLSIVGPIRLLGMDAVATDDAFILVRGRRQSRRRVQVPVDLLGTGPVEIVAERGAGGLPLLLPILATTLLARGIVGVHASAFRVGETAVLVSGWAKGGKSEALLTFVSRGASYIGDEWVFLDPETRQMIGLPEPMRLWDWQLSMVPEVERRVGRARRLRLAVAAGFAGSLGVGGGAPGLRATPIGEAARRLRAVADRQRSLQVPPARLFGADRILAVPVAIDRAIIIESAEAEETATLDLAVDEAARRMALTTTHELLDLEATRLAYAYAFPERPLGGLERPHERLEEGIRRALTDVPIGHVRHRYPPDLDALHDLIANIL